ncbi:methyl-accepting chemotaxis protein [Spirochaeta africana]|nr:methyl-accepting chemotaxis protein [Spirochaeta africana]
MKLHAGLQALFWALTLAAGILLPAAGFVAVAVVCAAGSLALGTRRSTVEPATPSVTATPAEAAVPREATVPGEIPDITDPADSPLDDLPHAGSASAPAGQDMAAARQLLDRLAEVLVQLPSRNGMMNEARRLTDDELRPRLQQLREDTGQVLNDVSRAYDISDNLSKTANDAFALAAKVQKGIENINETLRQSLQNTEFLEEQSRKISRILDLMGDISSQIQVLSMNASIVSARAGVHGKGFEVVAKEIRTLSHQTEESLQEIASSIEGIQQTIRTVGGDTHEADRAAAEETKSLMSVAGSLQGVQLAVEVVHTVSTTSRDRIQQQSERLAELEGLYNRLDEALQEADGESDQRQELQGLIEELRGRLG